MLSRYLIAGLAFVTLALAGVVAYQRGNVIEAEAEVERITVERDKALAVSQQKDKEIERLTRLSNVANEVTADLAKQVQELSNKADETRQALAEMENQNAEVKSLFDTALPADLKRLLERR